MFRPHAVKPRAPGGLRGQAAGAGGGPGGRAGSKQTVLPAGPFGPSPVPQPHQRSASASRVSSPCPVKASGARAERRQPGGQTAATARRVEAMVAEPTTRVPW